MKITMASLTLIFVFILLAWMVFNLYKEDHFDAAAAIKGKRVLVTGASSGIGEQVAYKYAELGAKLLITARRADLLRKVADKCGQLGTTSVVVVPADMADPHQRLTLVNEIKKSFEGLDILILNHAIIHYGMWNGTRENFTLLQEMLNVNFLSYVDLTCMLIDSLEQGHGHIGVMSSLAGKSGAIGLTHYSAGKHALQGFYSSLRQELSLRRSGVTVTIAAFGIIDSDRVVQLINEHRPSSYHEAIVGHVDDAADALIKGVAKRAHEIHFPVMAKVVNIINRLMPAYLEDFNVWHHTKN